VPALSLRSSISALTALLIPGLLLGCGSDSSTAAEEPQATAIVVSAADFLNGAQCVAAPGALRRWGVNLKHTAHPEPLPGAPPVDAPLVDLSSGRLVDCVQGIAFGNVELGGTYQATICGYDDPELELEDSEEDVCALRSGRAPGWKYTCSEVVVEYQALRQVRDCRLETEPPDPGKTEVSVTLGSPWCDAGENQVERFRVFRDGEPFGAGEAVCGEPLTAAAMPNEVFDLELLAYRAGEEAPAYGAVCHARAIAGATVSAACDPLASQGGIELSIEDALGALGATCEDGLLDLLVTLDSGQTLEVPDPCRGTVRFSSVPPGTREVSLSAVRGGEMLTAACTAEVEPGLSSSADCSAE
jgi:hypothetical protein